ncbi:BatD family protein [Spirosoma arcticum]
MADTDADIQLGLTSFSIERPFTISVTVRNSETRPVITFPDIPGFTKKGILTNVTTADRNEKNGTGQVITQNYQARTAGRFVLAPFTITVSGEVLTSTGAVLIVRPSVTATVPLNTTLAGTATLANGVAFLTLRSSKSVVYAGEGVALTLSFFVADNYPYELSFTALDRQLQAIIKKIRPANAWEENRLITELKPLPVLIGGKKFREIQLYQSIFYPLATRPLTLPAVTLRLARPQPKIGPPSSEVETVEFSSKPLTVAVRALPPHPLRGRVAVGSFRLNERLDQQRVSTGQSVRYGFSIEGEGNVATLPAPATSVKTAAIDVFPPEEKHSINHGGSRITGQKTFTYFIVPRQNGTIWLVDYFQWIYFDPQRARYDTLRSQLRVQVGGTNAATTAKTGTPTGTSGVSGAVATELVPGRSLYAGIDALDSTHQPIRIAVLIRAVANVLIVLMLLGMIFVLFKR